MMPSTHWTFLFGCLALAGIVPFAGFWSKDAILAAVHDKGAHDLAASTTCLLVAWCSRPSSPRFYTFRGYFLTFYGEQRDAARGRASCPRVAAGDDRAAGDPGRRARLVVGPISSGPASLRSDFLVPTPSLAYSGMSHDAATGPSPSTGVASISTLVALSGVGLAAFFYWAIAVRSPGWRRMLAALAVRAVLRQIFHRPDLSASVVWPAGWLARLLLLFDRWIIDGLVNLVGAFRAVAGSVSGRCKTGMVQFYALAMVLGVLVLIGTCAWR